jgi:flagellar secretion chaperone FliS
MEYGGVSLYGRNTKLAAYQSVSVHGGVANADPHGLVLMLMDGAVERMTTARGCMERGEIVRKAKLLHSCISLIAELRGCLDLARGGAIAQNLSDLYDYMMRQLLRANADNNPAFISEVLSLLAEIRGAWIAIGPEVRHMARAVLPSA